MIEDVKPGENLLFGTSKKDQLRANVAAESEGAIACCVSKDGTLLCLMQDGNIIYLGNATDAKVVANNIILTSDELLEGKFHDV